MTYRINFWNKKTNEIVKTVFVESENNIGIILKAKIKAFEDGFEFNKKSHDASFSEV